MKKIDISTPNHPNTFAIVDDCDYEELNEHKWYCSGNGYAVRQLTRTYGQETILMHRQILGNPNGTDTDHINRIRLDNRRRNLRACSRQQNSLNLSKPKSNKSGYKGVCRNNGIKKWRAHIHINGKQKYLGLFVSPIDAAKAYDKAAKKYHGEFANTNF